MSEKRRPDVVFAIRSEDTERRYEIFHADQFIERARRVPFVHAEQPDLLINPADLAAGNFVRVRLNGIWQPPGKRAFWPAHRLGMLIGADVSKQLKKPDAT